MTAATYTGDNAKPLKIEVGKPMVIRGRIVECGLCNGYGRHEGGKCASCGGDGWRFEAYRVNGQNCVGENQPLDFAPEQDEADPRQVDGPFFGGVIIGAGFMGICWTAAQFFFG